MPRFLPWPAQSGLSAQARLQAESGHVQGPLRQRFPFFAYLTGDRPPTMVAYTPSQLDPRQEGNQRKLATSSIRADLEALRQQREQVLQYVTQLEKQLPGKAEMDALLSDINQAGLGRSLYFDLFRPGQVTVKDYYAELPIALKVTGRYHDIGAFAADIANLSRIVTLNNLTITPAKDGLLVMEATAKTFRYLDPEVLGRIAYASGGRIGYQPFSEELCMLGYAAASDVFGASLYEPCGQIDQVGNIFGATATNRASRANT